VWSSYEAIVDACCEAWNKLVQMPERIASITQRSWAQTVSRVLVLSLERFSYASGSISP
jgi:hypothetical protein